MDFESKTNYGGVLLFWTADKVSKSLFADKFSEIRDSALNAMSWEQYSFTNSEPILKDERLFRKILENIGRSSAMPSEYFYSFLVRRSGQKLLLLGKSRDIISYVINKSKLSNVKPRFTPLHIRLDAMVRNFKEDSTRYLLVYAHAQMNIQKNVFDRISFYGNDLIKADYFRETLEHCTIVSCGLNIKDSIQDNTANIEREEFSCFERHEMVRIGANGTVSINVRSVGDLKKLEETLAFLRDNNYFKMPLDVDENERRQPW